MPSGTRCELGSDIMPPSQAAGFRPIPSGTRCELYAVSLTLFRAYFAGTDLVREKRARSLLRLADAMYPRFAGTDPARDSVLPCAVREGADAQWASFSADRAGRRGLADAVRLTPLEFVNACRAGTR